MLYSDAHVPTSENPFSDISFQTINLDVISEIQKELETYDLISLVFLLYDVPDTALQRLCVLQRVSKDIEGNHLNLLHDWAAAQTVPTWRQQFLEALAICQLNSVIRKLGFHVRTVRDHYLSHEPHIAFYVNPMKKALYQLCESMTSETFSNLKRALDSFDYDVMKYDSCELVFLEIMCQKFITVNHYKREGIINQCMVENLVKIIDKYPDLNKYVSILRDIENKMNSSPSTSCSQSPDAKSTSKVKEDGNNTKPTDFKEILNMLEELNLEDEDLLTNLKSDRQSTGDVYEIKNKDRVGICCIINQEVFHPSRDSLERSSAEPLDKRAGSTKDKIMLEKTMRSLNFQVMSVENVNRKQMLAFIQEVVQKRVSENDSMFMLCILSHGIRGHVYAADSVAIKVDYIQSILDDALTLRGKPKVLILQACQVQGDSEAPAFEADAPAYYVRKTDFLVYWATAPELEAYRSPQLGSLFIQILCAILYKCGDKEHLFDLFTKVTNKVILLCSLKHRDQVPIFKSTLRKKLFLQYPSAKE